MRRCFAAALTVLGLAFVGAVSTGCSGDDAHGAAPTLRFTAIPDSDSTQLEEKFAPFAAHLGEVLGVPVEFVPSIDYAASVEMFKNGDVHLAWFGGLSGVRARRAVEGAVAIAQGATDPHFKSYFVANASTGLTRSEEFPQGLAGRTFVFGSPGSTSGRLMPEHFIREATGETSEEFFGSLPNFSGSHDRTALMVQAGEAEAGALNYVVYDDMVEAGEIDPAVCRVVWVTPDYVDYNWTARPEVDIDFGDLSIEKLQAALLAIDDPELLSALRRPDGLIAASNDDYASIEQTAEALGLLR